VGVGEFGDWIAYHQPRPLAKVRLFCFAHAGGTALAYRTWAEKMPREIEVCPIQLPGREKRWIETPIAELRELLERLTPLFRSVQDKPFAFFGHSLGSTVAFEVARELRRTGLPAPVRLIASAGRAPVLRKPTTMHELPDDQFLEEVFGIGGTPDHVMQNQELRELILPMLRGDFTLIGKYSYVKEAPFDFPITAFGGETDPRASREQLEMWQHETTAGFDCKIYPGGHFYLREVEADLLKAIAARLNGRNA
jgi:medium-chain acyl-[acyl-carrier-protein] hydrolase